MCSHFKSVTVNFSLAEKPLWIEFWHANHEFKKKCITYWQSTPAYTLLSSSTIDTISAINLCQKPRLFELTGPSAAASSDNFVSSSPNSRWYISMQLLNRNWYVDLMHALTQSLTIVLARGGVFNSWTWRIEILQNYKTFKPVIGFPWPALSFYLEFAGFIINLCTFYTILTLIKTHQPSKTRTRTSWTFIRKKVMLVSRSTVALRSCSRVASTAGYEFYKKILHFQIQIQTDK